MTTDQEAQDEMRRWGGVFLEAIDALHEGESPDVARDLLLGPADQMQNEVNYRLWMLLPVGAWIAGQLIVRATPESDQPGCFGLELADDAEPGERTAGRLAAAAANGEDGQVMALVRAERETGGWQALADTLGALASLAAPMWDRKPVDL